MMNCIFSKIGFRLKRNKERGKKGKAFRLAGPSVEYHVYSFPFFPRSLFLLSLKPIFENIQFIIKTLPSL
jgi:hypothetical protein